MVQMFLKIRHKPEGSLFNRKGLSKRVLESGVEANFYSMLGKSAFTLDDFLLTIFCMEKERTYDRKKN